MTIHNNILCLDTDLFPDRGTLVSALSSEIPRNDNYLEIRPAVMGDSYWDTVLFEIMHSDLTIVF